MLFPATQTIVMQADADDLEPIADLHAQAFARGWDTSELLAMKARAENTLLVARKVGFPKGPVAGFNIFRSTGAEAEILSIAVDPALRAAGLGTNLMREAIRHLRADRIPELFLEVAETNTAAITLYKKLGFETVATRASYYSDPENPDQRVSALVMRMTIA